MAPVASVKDNDIEAASLFHLSDVGHACHLKRSSAAARSSLHRTRSDA